MVVVDFIGRGSGHSLIALSCNILLDHTDLENLIKIEILILSVYVVLNP